MKKNIILEKSLDYALITVKLYKHLQSKNEYILSKQLLRSATSVGANVRESNNTLTKKDFVYKLNIAQKELDESIYWLELPFAPITLINSPFKCTNKRLPNNSK